MTLPAPEAPDPEDTSKPSSVQRIAKGCGCTVALVVLALGILIIGNFDSGAWASALGAVVIGYLVYNMSGVNGFWEK